MVMMVRGRHVVVAGCQRLDEKLKRERREIKLCVVSFVVDVRCCFVLIVDSFV